jgi:pyruvate/2-oxoglutarate dehydrogenase complex dihydrolipoamide dehydrogenase (E3) component
MGAWLMGSQFPTLTPDTDLPTTYSYLMPVDYDLVILGGSPVARYAAAKASRLQARVALVEPEGFQGQMASHLVSTLHQLGRLTRLVHQSPQWGFQPSASLTFPFRQAQTWAQDVTEAIAITKHQTLDSVTALGVDVIVGEGRFERHPHPSFGVNGRRLRSRRYLLAPATYPFLPTIDGLSDCPFLTVDSLPQQPWTSVPDRLIILGNEPSAIELAQSFQRLGSQVTLIRHQALLTKIDPVAIGFIQAQLEAEGVRIFTQEASQVRQSGEAIQVLVGDRSLAADALLVAMGRQISLASWNLEAIGVKWQPWGIPVNRRLQTTHPRIYACGDALGGYPLPHIALFEADLALQNILFQPQSIDYRPVPWTLFTDPELVQIGLTEAQARRAYGQKITVISASCQSSIKAQILDATSGFCQLILHRNGKLLGAQLIGREASEWSSPIALAMQQNLRISDLARFPYPSPTFIELLSQLINRWQHEHFTSKQRNWQEAWFDLRRSIGW